MVDDGMSLRDNATDNLTLIAPRVSDKLTPEQVSELRKFVAVKIANSDELLGAVTRKIKELTGDDECS